MKPLCVTFKRLALLAGRRKRLVVLTQRAFDLLSGLGAHRRNRFRGHSLQAHAEHTELERFRMKLAKHKVGVSNLSRKNRRPLGNGTALESGKRPIAARNGDRAFGVR